jgi:hypothetical protein
MKPSEIAIFEHPFTKNRYLSIDSLILFKMDALIANQKLLEKYTREKDLVSIAITKGIIAEIDSDINIYKQLKISKLVPF